MTVKTFKDLESVAIPSSSDVLDLISDYAVNGMEIQSKTVIGLINRVNLTKEDLDKTRLYLQVGNFYWTKYGNSKAAREYQEVLENLNSLS
ncbi:MAG: hypothetical protein WC867_00185 [Candidatus Pacearchaeota archaeon]|jgi:hypothetical protein